MYIGSFNADKPVRSDLNPAGVELFEKEQSDLLQDLYDIPQRACDRKVTDPCPSLAWMCQQTCHREESRCAANMIVQVRKLSAGPVWHSPVTSLLVQVNEFVKRVRAAKIHCLIMGHLRKQMPAMMGKQKAQEKLLKDLANQFSHVQREHHLPAGDLAMWKCPSR